MDICIASDDNYSLIMTVLIVSIFENNLNEEEITVHIFEDEISETHIGNIKYIEKKYNRRILFYNISEYIEKIKYDINNEWANRNSYTCYARLFMADMLPSDVKKFLYLDCDTLIISSLSDLFKIDLNGSIVGAVRDVLPSKYKNKLGLLEYFNSGVLLIDRDKWISNGVSQKILDFCAAHSDDSFPDQDAINVSLSKNIYMLPPKYCVFMPENSFSYTTQIFGYGERDHYYSCEQLLEASSNPVIIHLVDTFLGRPWHVNNIHPFSSHWNAFAGEINVNQTQFMVEKKMSFNQKIQRLLYFCLPKCMFAIIFYVRKNSGINEYLK